MVKIAVSSQSRLAHDPAALLREVNRTLRGEVRRAFVTATYLYFDGATVAIANAGHPPPLLCRGGEIRELGTQGVLLGRFDTAYAAETTPLASGDRIVACTDGVIEARNARGEEFGEERLKDAVRRGASAAEIARAARAWAGDQSDADDITLVVIDVVP
jgi:serine phosphatase RsbU (regulator of sigma subunit)